MILETHLLTKTYKLARSRPFAHRPTLDALTDVDFHVNEGETVGIVGESGSGKSTLARLLIGLEKPTSGEVLFRGEALANSRDEKRTMQIVFQDPNGSLDPRLRVAKIITEPLRGLRIDGDHQARLFELLDAVGLPASAAERYPHEFSGGQRQRIAIARALAPHPKVLIADEAVSALDVSVRAKTLNLLQDLKDQFSLTLVIIAHDLSVTHHISDRVAVMSKGRIVEQGEAEEVFQNPKHAYTRELLDAIPRLRPSI